MQEEMMHCTEWREVLRMNEMEAKDWLKAISCTTIDGVCMEQRKEALHLGMQALEKQIPQNVVNQGGTPLSGYCPRCNAEVTKPSSPVGCKWCLQRVKWEGVEYGT